MDKDKRNELATIIDKNIYQLRRVIKDYSTYIEYDSNAIEFFVEYIDSRIHCNILNYLRGLK